MQEFQESPQTRRFLRIIEFPKTRRAIAMEFEVFESVTSSPAPVEATSPLVRLQYLIDNTPAIIYATVPSGDFKMTFVSNNAYNVLGYRPEEMLADPNFWFDHIHPDDAPSIFSSLAQLFVEASVRTNTGSARPAASSCGCTTACA
ncbi:conserved hypothetical protein [Ricinus communis]|uniref:PAS domain-containing protein n=1 Tax=Ricinus communis TaxID=3988 RepID=B9TK34_RICCO|nr:conserved hypothetical protein [Ricinus communis]